MCLALMESRWMLRPIRKGHLGFVSPVFCKSERLLLLCDVCGLRVRIAKLRNTLLISKNTHSLRLSRCPSSPTSFGNTEPMARILVVDDDPSMVQVISELCRESGHETVAFNSGTRALTNLADQTVHLVITDMRMEGCGGMDVLKACKRVKPDVPVIMVTGDRGVEQGVQALKAGAFDYVTKPFKVEDLRGSISRALSRKKDGGGGAVEEERSKRSRVPSKPMNIIGSSKRMQEVFNLIGKVANLDSTILIQGESGTGKELVARALHFNSHRADKAFVPINCSALPENLLESELFGHKKGAFTGAFQDKIGLFEEAEGGTIFLDEINSMAPALQTKLLRVLQERRVRRVGDTKSIEINVRVLTATNEPLYPKTRNGTFREDLYYRIAVIPIEVPALRERPEDIPDLVAHFLRRNASSARCAEYTMDGGVLERLMGYSWPGNVRELENAVERACALCDDCRIRSADLPATVLSLKGPDGVSSPSPLVGYVTGRPLSAFLEHVETRYISETIAACQGSREKAAKLLQISLATLYRKLEAGKRSVAVDSPDLSGVGAKVSGTKRATNNTPKRMEPPRGVPQRSSIREVKNLKHQGTGANRRGESAKVTNRRAPQSNQARPRPKASGKPAFIQSARKKAKKGR
jgi:DNA-binding NtrC family response regulator